MEAHAPTAKVYVTLFRNDGLLNVSSAKPFALLVGWTIEQARRECHLRLYGTHSPSARLFTDMGVELDDVSFIPATQNIVVASDGHFVPPHFAARAAPSAITSMPAMLLRPNGSAPTAEALPVQPVPPPSGLGSVPGVQDERLREASFDELVRSIYDQERDRQAQQQQGLIPTNPSVDYALQMVAKYARQADVEKQDTIRSMLSGPQPDAITGTDSLPDAEYVDRIFSEIGLPTMGFDLGLPPSATRLPAVESHDATPSTLTDSPSTTTDSGGGAAASGIGAPADDQSSAPLLPSLADGYPPSWTSPSNGQDGAPAVARPAAVAGRSKAAVPGAIVKAHSHKASEQRSRDRLRNSIQELVVTVPSLANVKNPSKATIIHKAAEYVEYAKQTNQALMEENKRAQMMIAQLQAEHLRIRRTPTANIVTIEILDLERRFVFVDHMWEIVIGYSHKEVVGKMVKDVIGCPKCRTLVGVGGVEGGRGRAGAVLTSLQPSCRPSAKWFGRPLLPAIAGKATFWAGAETAGRSSARRPSPRSSRRRARCSNM